MKIYTNPEILRAEENLDDIFNSLPEIGTEVKRKEPQEPFEVFVRQVQRNLIAEVSGPQVPAFKLGYKFFQDELKENSFETVITMIFVTSSATKSVEEIKVCLADFKDPEIYFYKHRLYKNKKNKPPHIEIKVTRKGLLSLKEASSVYRKIKKLI